MQVSKWNVLTPAHAIVALLLAVAMPASAGVVMNATRYVYDAGEKEVTVKLTNKGALPVLTQAWIDEGDARSTPEHVDVPFNLTPPIARMEPGKSQTLRVSFTDGTLPGDRESLFWLNVLEVPPKPEENAEVNRIQLAFRYRLKLFYRPKGLKGSPSAAADGLHWALSPDGKLTVANDSAFHVTLNELHLAGSGETLDVEPFSVAPHVTLAPALPRPFKGAHVELRYQTINDYGGFVPHTTAIDAR